MVNVPILLNLVTYLRGTMHMGVSDSATTITNFIGATSGFSLIGAFLSDSYISCSKTMLLFGPLEFLVIFLLVFWTSYSLQRYFAFSVILLDVTKIFCIFCCFTKCKLSTVDNTMIVSVRELNKELQYLKIDFEKGYPIYFKFWMKVSTFIFTSQRYSWFL